MIKTFESYNEWSKCPDDYEFEVGERVKINPNSEYEYQVKGNKMGTIVERDPYDDDYKCWSVKWDDGADDCVYWRRDLLIRKEEINDPVKIRWYKNGKLSEKFFWQKDNNPSDLQFVSIRREIQEYLRDNRDSTLLNFFQDNMIGEEIRLNCTIIRKPYKFISIGHVKKGNVITGHFELILREIFNTESSNIFLLYDDKYKYVTSTINLMNCMALRKVNRLVNEMDPLGEENWDED